MRRTTTGSAAAPRRVGIKDIARTLGVSIGTVDRALHDKPGINPATRARVLATAEALGYRPNLAARHLKSGITISIAAHLPQEIAQFWESLEAGIREAAQGFEPTLHVSVAHYPRYGEGDTALFEATLAAGVDGLIVAPGDPTALAPWIRRAFEKGVPVACVVTDAPDTDRLISVSADPATVGAIGGELFSRFLPSGGDVAFLTGWLGTQDHAEKLRGFEQCVQALGCDLRLARVVEAHEDEAEAYRRTADLLAQNPALKGIYVSTVNSLPVLRALQDAGRVGSVMVVTTDLFPDLVPWIRDGTVAATLYQRPLTQGRLAVQHLYRYLLDGTRPPVRIKVMPHVVMRSNLDLVLERVP